MTSCVTAVVEVYVKDRFRDFAQEARRLCGSSVKDAGRRHWLQGRRLCIMFVLKETNSDAELVLKNTLDFTRFLRSGFHETPDSIG